MHNLTAATQAVPLETYGGLVTLARPENVPEGASPRNYNMDYLVGSAQTRQPLENTCSFANSGEGPNPGDAVSASGWGNPGNILVDDGNYAIATAGNSNFLNVTEFAFDLPSTATPTGVLVTLKGWANSDVQVQLQLLFNGVPVGMPKTLALPTSPGTITFGGFSDNWGTSLTRDAVNGTGFGVQISVSSNFPAAQALLGFVSIELGQTAANANFNFLTTFVAQDGSVKNLSLDADGNFWVEDLSNNPGVLTLAFDGIASDSFASGVNGPGVEYVAFNDLTAGSDVPRQYTPQWTDKISQVGPGAPPAFIASNNTAGAVPITAFSITSNIVTLTAENNFTAGELVGINGMGVADYLNGLSFTVLGTGLSSIQFEIEFTHADVSSTGDDGTATPQTAYPITSITQPAPGFPGQGGRFDGIELSSGPGSSSAGNVVTIYTAESRPGRFPGGDPVLTAAFNSGQPVYVFIQGAPFGNGTQLVTSIGQAIPNFAGAAGVRWYLTFTVPTSGFQTAGGSDQAIAGTYQITAATLTTGSPIPGAAVGNQITIVGTDVEAWNDTWTLTQALDSGAMAITQTESSGGVATYNYAVTAGQPPQAGQLVTITGTLNGNGAFNVTDAVIASSSGGATGTFTIGNFATTAGLTPEEGQATTAGTEFMFDPGLSTLGTANNPIFGNAAGGQVTLVGQSTQPIGSGTRQAVVFFITRNGFYTAPSPPVTFNTPDNTNSILASNIPIGPPNVIARAIAFTEAGQNGVPGANFFFIPQNVVTTVFGVSTTATATVVFDNTSTTAIFSFTDDVLLNATAIDIQGFNLFNLIEIGNPGWIVNYSSRNFYGLCQNKIQNFLNMSFDGGYLPSGGGIITPLGWSAFQADGSPGTLLVSPVFGNSYYIKNTTGVQASVSGMIFQGAFQDAYQVPILRANTAYSVRVTARIPSGNTTGDLAVDLTTFNQGSGFGPTLGSFALPFGAMSTSMATFTGTLLTSTLATVPSGLVVRVYGGAMGDGADVEIDRVEIFPTAIPVLATTVFGSYANLLESVDAITGPVQFVSENQQPVNGAFVMYDTFYAVKQSSMYSLQASPNLEPAQWNEPEVAQKAGACGVNAYDFGEQWGVIANRNGLYLFEGGQPGKIMMEIFQIWNAINWNAGKSIWVRNDVPNRRLFVGVPLPTPNFWLPDAPANPAPTSPNVILMMNYQGCETGDAIKQAMQMHETMFGSLNAVDMRRKWSIWTIASPYAASVSATGQVGFVDGEVNILDAEMRFCNGTATSKIYRLKTDLAPDAIPTDDGVAYKSLYTTYGYVNVSKAAQMPMLGMFRKLWKYMTHQISGAGNLAVRLLPNTLLGPTDSTAKYYPWTLPGGFTLSDPCTQIHEAPLNFAGTRTFVELSTTGRMDLSNLVIAGTKHPHNQLTGQR